MSAFFREVLWTRLKRNRMAMAGALIVLMMFCFAMFAPVSGRDPGAIDIALRLQGDRAGGHPTLADEARHVIDLERGRGDGLAVGVGGDRQAAAQLAVHLHHEFDLVAGHRRGVGGGRLADRDRHQSSTSQPRWWAASTAERMTAFSPGASPPPVLMSMVLR